MWENNLSLVQIIGYGCLVLFGTFILGFMILLFKHVVEVMEQRANCHHDFMQYNGNIEKPSLVCEKCGKQIKL